MSSPGLRIRAELWPESLTGALTEFVCVCKISLPGYRFSALSSGIPSHNPQARFLF